MRTKSEAERAGADWRRGNVPAGVPRETAGFSLVETSIAMGLIGVVLVGMLGGLNWVVSSVEWTPEYDRATQLMEEKLDTLRLYSWDQLNEPG